MNKRLLLTVAAAGIAVTALAGCSSMGSSSSAAPSSSPSSAPAAPVAAKATLSTGKTSLGNIVVNSKGDTVYVFTKDTANSGMSACYTTCASVWPAVTTTSANPTVKGVTGTIGTITRTDGTKQVTLNGMPLYTFASDSKAGDVGGQGLMKIWYVVTPAGTQITTAP